MPTDFSPEEGLVEEGMIVAHSPHRRFKGCQLCAPHKFRDNGRSVREPWAVLRKIGKKRRVKRNDLGDQD